MPFAEHRIMYPSEWVPLPLLLLNKYRSESNLKPWSRDGFDIVPFKYWRIPLKHMAFQWSRMPAKYTKEKVDLVHAHFLFPDGLFAMQLWKSHQTPYIITLRSSGLQLMKQCRPGSSTYQLGLKALKNADAVTVLNHAGKLFLENIGLKSIHLIPHGLANSDYISESSIENKRHRPGIRISTVGNRLVTKNIDWVVDYAMKSPIALHLDVIGPVEIDQKVIELRHPGTKIQFHGRISRDKVLELLRKSDIFALPSSRESFGLSYLEAAANYNAIIGFKGQGPIGIFNQEEMMFPADRSMFKICLEKLMNEETLRMAMARKAYIKAQKLTWDKITDMYENLYKEAL